VLGFTLGASLLTGILFGLAPAIHSARLDMNDSLKEGGRGATEGRGRNRVHSLLVVSEVALSLVLLVGAGLLIKSFVKLRNTDPGFDPRNTLTASLSLAPVRYAKDEQVNQFYDQLIERVRALPGVQEVGAVAPLPLSNNGMSYSFVITDRPEPPPGQGLSASARFATPGYFRAMGIPLRRGRLFTEQDRADAPAVLVVNDAFARRYFSGEEVLGKRLRLGFKRLEVEIVGVVGDVRGNSLSEPGIPEYYIPQSHAASGDMSLVVRTSTTDPAALTPALREVVREMDKDQPLYEVRTMSALVTSSMARQRFSTTLIGVFAALALALAAVGIFSVMSYSVAQRKHEIGIRMALGAQSRDILRMVLGRGMMLTLIGVGLGLAASFGLTRLMSSLLFGVSATDPVTFGGVAVLLASVALLACYAPARRATKVDPMVALRHE
jgi:putative ABC transport system permease protein